jgi:hypothetical protein
MHLDEDTEQHDTFFIAHSALISSQDVLRILVCKFKEASGDIRVGHMRFGRPPFALFNF